MPTPKRCYLIVKKSMRGELMHANAWYGDDHPLTPLVVYGDYALLDPKPFPVEAMKQWR